MLQFFSFQYNSVLIFQIFLFSMDYWLQYALIYTDILHIFSNYAESLIKAVKKRVETFSEKSSRITQGLFCFAFPALNTVSFA